jgi:hypothetical protein
MRFDSFYQFLVPLTFLAIWALTSLFNREAQPLPPRSGRAPGPNGPRPAADGTSHWRPELSQRESTISRPSTSGASNSSTARSGGVRPEDEIRIIDSEPRRSSPMPKPRVAPPAARRGVKPRGQTPSVSKKAESSSSRSMGTLMSRSMAADMGTPKSLISLSLPPSPLLSDFSVEAPGTDESRARAAQPIAINAIEVRKLAASPARIRESFILSELLQPPLALRGRSFTRR